MDVLQMLNEMEDRRGLLNKINKLDNLEYYLKEFHIDMGNNENLLIVFQDKLENIYNFCIYLPPIYVHIWNGRRYTKDKYDEYNCYEFVKRCILYWGNLIEIDAFWEGDYENALKCAQEYGKFNVVKHLIKEKRCPPKVIYDCRYPDILDYLLEASKLSTEDLNEMLCEAAERGNIIIVKHLVEKYCNDLDINEALLCTMKLEIIKYLIEKSGITIKPATMDELLSCALEEKQTEVIQYLSKNK